MFQRNLTRAFGFILFACLGGCADLPPYYQTLSKQTQTEMADLKTQQVFYATDRKVVSGSFTATPGAMTYGDCALSVPAIHDIGNDVLTEQLSQSIAKTKVGQFQLKTTNSSLSHS